MDQHYKSAAARLEEILKEHKQGLSKDELSLTALIRELKDGVPQKIEVETKFNVLENAFKKKQPDFWKKIEEIRNSLATDSTVTVGAEISPDAPEQKASYLEGASKIIQELYIQAMEVNDDHEQEKPDTLTTTITMKGTEDTGHADPKKTEPDIAKELERKCIAVAAALKKMKDVKVDLELASKIIEDLHSQVIEDTVNQAQAKPEEPTATGSMKGGDNMCSPIPPKTEPHMPPKLEKKSRTGSSSSTKIKDATPRSKKGTQENEHTVPTTQPDIAHELEMKGTAILLFLQNMKDTKGDFERASKIIQELYNQVMEVTDDKEKTEPLMSSSSKRETNDTGRTTRKKIESDIGKELEMKGVPVSEGLKKMKDTKGNTWHEMKIYKQDCNLKEITETQTTTGFKQVVVDTRSTVPKSTEPSMTPKREERANAVLATSWKTIDTTSGSNKETQETEHTVPTKIEPDIAHELEMKARAVSAALLQMKDAEGRVNTLKNEYEFLMHLLDALHESVIEVEHKTGKNKSSATPGNEPSKHDMASKILRSFQEKKSEAEYAACLLEELSRFSHVTNKDDSGNILSCPQNVKTSQDFKEKDAKNVDDSQHKPQHCVHDENLMKYYIHASHVLKEMKESRGLRIDLGTKTGQLEVLRTKLKSIQDENTKLMNEADSLRTRLSEHAGALLNHDNPAIADLSDPNRATKLGEKYLEVYDNQWTDAFSKLQSEYSSASDEELTGHLYNILVDGYVFCKDARKAQLFNLQEIMFNPTGDMTKSRRRPKEEVSKGFSNILSDAAKLSSNVASGNIAKAFVKNEGTKNRHGKMIKLCETYIQECVQLCWYMQVQTPPLYLDVNTAKGQEFEKNSYKEYTTRGKKIAFVVWPALFLHENGPLLSKGVAQGDSTRKQAAND